LFTKNNALFNFALTLIASESDCDATVRLFQHQSWRYALAGCFCERADNAQEQERRSRKKLMENNRHRLLKQRFLKAPSAQQTFGPAQQKAKLYSALAKLKSLPPSLSSLARAPKNWHGAKRRLGRISAKLFQ
jgi:hypothetical protein